MTTTMTFKYKMLDENGNQSGFLAKKGTLDGDCLTLDGQEIPIIAIRRAVCRFGRLVLELIDPDAEEPPIAVFAITKGKAERIAAGINLESSQRWADLRRQALVEQGKGDRFRSARCPACEATVDISGHPASQQLYCSYCDSVVTVSGQTVDGEGDLHCCDACGMYAKPRGFTTFYFYFLLVIYGWRSQQHYMCHSCMRGEAWKMFFGNLLFILGVPFAVVQLIRAYRAGAIGSPAFAGLDAANALAKAKKVPQAIARYEQICQRLPAAAGIRYNIGLAEMSRGNWDGAMAALEQALADCSNHQQSAVMLAQVYTAAQQPEKLAALKAAWGDEGDEQAA